jgi:hypothetical protein
MLLKTKGRCAKLGNEAGMFMKKRHLITEIRNVVENKDC